MNIIRLAELCDTSIASLQDKIPCLIDDRRPEITQRNIIAEICHIRDIPAGAKVAKMTADVVRGNSRNLPDKLQHYDAVIVTSHRQGVVAIVSTRVLLQEGAA